MKFRIVLDTSLCDSQPERVQQYLASSTNGLDVWATPRLSKYPKSVVRVYKIAEVEYLTMRQLAPGLPPYTAYTADLTTT